MKLFFVSLKARLPGGYILYDLLWSAVDFRYGLRITSSAFFITLRSFVLAAATSIGAGTLLSLNRLIRCYTTSPRKLMFQI